MTDAEETEALLNSDPILYTFINGINPVVENTKTSWKIFKTSLLENLRSGIPTTKASVDFSRPHDIALYTIQEFTLAQSRKIKSQLTSKQTFPSIEIDNYGRVTVGSDRFPSPVGTVLDELKKYNKINLTPDRATTIIPADYIKNNMYSWSENFFISTNLKYILVYDDSTSKYYTCINPLHSRGFKKYYKLNILNNNDPAFDYGAAFKEDTPAMKAITRYCNAFIVDGQYDIKQTGTIEHKPRVYLDPFCGLLIDKKTQQLNRHYNTNIVSYYYKNAFFKDQSIGKKLTDLIFKTYNEEINQFTCTDSRSDSPFTLASQLKLWDNGYSDSFLYEYSSVASHGRKNTQYPSNKDLFNTIPDCPAPDRYTCAITIIAKTVESTTNTTNCGKANSDQKTISDYENLEKEADASLIDDSKITKYTDKKNWSPNTNNETPAPSLMSSITESLDGIIDEKDVPYVIAGVIGFVVLIIIILILSK